MNRTTIWDILGQVYDYNNRFRLTVNNKTKDITIDGFGSPAPTIGNLEEIYKSNKSKVDKTVEEIIKITENFIDEMDKKFVKRRGEK